MNRIILVAFALVAMFVADSCADENYVACVRKYLGDGIVAAERVDPKIVPCVLPLRDKILKDTRWVANKATKLRSFKLRTAVYLKMIKLLKCMKDQNIGYKFASVWKAVHPALSNAKMYCSAL